MDTYLTAINIWLCISAAACGATPTASELLDKYAAGQEKLRSFTTQVETSREGFSSGTKTDRSRRFRIYAEADVRFDGRRACFRKASWGQISENDYYEKDKPYYLSALWDGTTFIHYRPQREGWNFLMIKQPKGQDDAAKTYENMLKGDHAAKFFLGYFYPWSARIDSLLREADTISVRPDMAKLGQTRCYVIDAAKDKAKYTVWIDPEHGYHTARIEIERRQRDAQALKLFSCVLKNVRFRQFDNVWVPVAADLEDRFVYPNGQYTNDTYHIEMKDIVLNPDHDKLRSFKADDIKDGSTVLFINGVHVRDHIWRGWKVLDKEGRVVLDCNPENESLSKSHVPAPSPVPAQDEMKAPQPGTRIVHLPDDYSIGRALIVEPQSQPLWHTVLVWPRTDAGPPAGDVNVPAGKMLRLDVWDAGPRAHNALARLGPDDVQILNFYQCKKADDRMLSAASRLMGLKVLFLGEGRFTINGLKHLTALRELRALQLPGDVPVESLELIRKLTALRYLNIGGPELTDAKMAKVGRLPWLTQLSIGGLERSEGLRHIAKLKSLRYLGLAAVRNPDLDRHLAYIADLTNIEELNLGDTLVGDAGFQHLKGMQKLKKLNIGNRYYPVSHKITDAGMVHLNNLKSLEELELPRMGITDIGLAQLAGLNALKKLNVGRDVTDEGMAALAKMKSLEDLGLGCPNITDAGLAELCRGSSLKSLSIGRCKVTDAGLANVANFRSLEYFSVSKVPINGAGLAVLKQCPSLREISLSFVELQSNAITHVAAIPSLERLSLYYIAAPITDESLNQLSRLTNLKMLSIVMKETSQMPITDAGIAHLSRLKKLEHVSLNHCEKITDEGLRHFEGLASLRRLRLDKSRVTRTGVDRLKAAIPGISVTVPATMRSAGQRSPSSSTRRTGRGDSTGREQTRRR